MHERSDPSSGLRISPTVRLGQNVSIHCFVNLYGCEIGDDSRVGAFVEIQKNATIGARCKISSHTFVCEGVTIEDEVFVGHGVMFINDLDPQGLRPLDLQERAFPFSVVSDRRDFGFVYLEHQWTHGHGGDARPVRLEARLSPRPARSLAAVAVQEELG